MKEAEVIRGLRVIDKVDSTLKEKSPQRRADIASTLGPTLNGDLTSLERRVAEAVARRLAEDAIETVRVALAISVRHSRFLPKDIALKLAYDVEAVSVPFLHVTEVFSDEELRDIAVKVSLTCKRAIGDRQRLSETICRVLLEESDPSLTRIVLENDGAELDEAWLLRLIETFTGDPTLFEAMAKRRALPASVGKLLIDKVSDATLATLSERYDIGPDFAAPLSREASLEAQFRHTETCSDPDLIDFLTALHRENRLSATQILRSIRERRWKFFEGAIAVRSDLPLEEARRRLKESNEEELQSLCAKADLPLALWPDILKEVRLVNQRVA